MHQLAEQWKHFGTSSIHKLESQIVDYQEKLNDLEQRQMSLLKENESLKSLVNQMMLTKISNKTDVNKKIKIYFFF
jgi:cell division protein FtsB